MKRTLKSNPHALTALIIASFVGVILLEVYISNNALTALLVWLGRSVIIAYAVHQAIIALAGMADDMLELFSGLGGLMYLVGVHLWTIQSYQGRYDLDLLLRVLGIALMLLPRVWRVTKLALTG